eukprot:scaffold108845_cov75-Phaeocystis_antarctica.AAC.1
MIQRLRTHNKRSRHNKRSTHNPRRASVSAPRRCAASSLPAPAERPTTLAQLASHSIVAPCTHPPTHGR